ncbi:MAG: alpha/beta hydrolase [Bacteroidota bacterium]
MMNFLNYKNHKIGYKLHNSEAPSTPVVLLHGFCEDMSMWEHVINYFNKQHFLITIDFPGFGSSDPLPKLTIEELSNTVKAILDHLHCKKCVLLGHSMGGYVSLIFAKLFPEYLSAWGLIHSHPYEDDAGKKQNRQKSIHFISTHGAAAYAKQLIPKLFPQDFANQNPTMINHLIEKAGQFPPEGISEAQSAMMSRENTEDVLAETKHPVLFIIGRLDQLEEEERLIRQTTLPKTSSIHILDEIGHVGPYEAPKHISTIIEEFLSLCSLLPSN